MAEPDAAGSVTIREATPGDWAAIWPILKQVTDAGETYAYPRDLDSATAYDIWMVPSPGSTVVAVDRSGRIVGTAHMHANRMGPGAHIATASFMVDVTATGRGIGRSLGEYVIGWAGDAGFRAIQFNAVVETNERAVALWRRLGFRIVGTVPEAFQRPDGTYVGLHIMHLPL